MMEIDLDGVDKDKRKTALTEIKKFFDRIFLSKENPISSIIITKEFQKVVQHFLEISEKRMNYDPHHGYGTACAKTIPYIKNSELVFAIVLDGKVFGKWADEHYVTRLAILAHELTHVGDFKRRCDRIGIENYFARPEAKHEILFANAWVIWTEYKAERVVCEIFDEFARKRHGKVDYSFALGHAEAIVNLLRNLPTYVKEGINDYRKWRLIPTDLCYRFTSRTTGILLLCAHVYALIDLSEELKRKTEEIERLEGFQIFLSNNWPLIHSILKDLYLRKNEYHPELIDKIAHEIDAILCKCGLELRDAKEGFYLDVHDVE